MRAERKPAPIHAIDARALMDERPAVRRSALAPAVALACALFAGLVLGWLARDRIARRSDEEQRTRIERLDGEVEKLRRILNMISWKGAADGEGQPDEEERR